MFQIGNVIRTKYGQIEIVIKVDDNYTQTISATSTNCSGGHRQKTYEEPETCNCGMIGCPVCDGGETPMKTRYGMDEAVLIAPTVKDWILKSLTKNFGL